MGGSTSPTSAASTSGQVFAPKATLPNAKPTVMQASLPTPADYAVNKMAAPQVGSMRDARQNYAANLMAEGQTFGEPENERNRKLLAELAQNAASGVSDAFGRAVQSQRQATNASQWASMQQQNQGTNGYAFQPDSSSAFQLADDQRNAVNTAWVNALSNVATSAIGAYGAKGAKS